FSSNERIRNGSCSEAADYSARLGIGRVGGFLVFRRSVSPLHRGTDETGAVRLGGGGGELPQVSALLAGATRPANRDGLSRAVRGAARIFFSRRPRASADAARPPGLVDAPLAPGLQHRRGVAGGSGCDLPAGGEVGRPRTSLPLLRDRADPTVPQ